MHTLHWFRADLRLTDNTALTQAIHKSTNLSTLYIITPKTWQRHAAAPIKIQFILNNLKVLSKQLWQQGIPLLLQTTDCFSDCAEVLAILCQKHKIAAVYFNKQYEIDEMRRDAQVTQTLEKLGIKVYAYDDQTVLAPGTVLSQQGNPLKIFTPFKKTWLTQVAQTNAWLPGKKSQKKSSGVVLPDLIPDQVPGFENSIDLSAWPAGEKSALHLLDKFCLEKISLYKLQRDYPALDGTSKLSAYLTQGVISPRQCIHALMQQQRISSFVEIGDFSGPATWLSELIWREFYKHIMFHFPAVCRYKPFNLATDNLPWRYNEEYFQAWCQGVTGFPLIDAAMRQVNQTGWMHNRLRMVVAMFLSKLMFLDWRRGENYFMQNLIDGDLSANNGGWQWSASTGTDAVPYFRIFNPVTQSKTYDPDGIFIKRFCPELDGLDNKTIHEPAKAALTLQYPKPIIDYKVCREETLRIFKTLRK